MTLGEAESWDIVADTLGNVLEGVGTRATVQDCDTAPNLSSGGATRILRSPDCSPMAAMLGG